MGGGVAEDRPRPIPLLQEALRGARLPSQLPGEEDIGEALAAVAVVGQRRLTSAGEAALVVRQVSELLFCFPFGEKKSGEFKQQERGFGTS